jgi:hypothetical protein
MINLPSFIDLHASFNSRYGIDDNLLHYLAMPRIPNNSFNFEEAKRVLFERQHPDKLDAIKMAPQDVSIFKKRAEVLSSNNKAYRIANTKKPSVEDLKAFSYISAGWACLQALKHYIMNHMDLAWEYNGFLPFGSAVAAFVNTLETRPNDISASPSYADHVYLQNISNREAQAFRMPSVEINNIMYLKGLKLLKKEKEEWIEDK